MFDLPSDTSDSHFHLQTRLTLCLVDHSCLFTKLCLPTNVGLHESNYPIAFPSSILCFLFE